MSSRRISAATARQTGQRPSKTTSFQLSGDIIGLVDALGETGAVIAGHDWGPGLIQRMTQGLRGLVTK